MPETPDYIYHEPGLPPWLDDSLKSCPPDGDGSRARHRWILECANGLRHHVPADKAAELIRQHLTRRVKHQKEISETIAKAYGTDPPDPAGTMPNFEPDLDCFDQVITDYVATGETLQPLDKLKSLSGPIPSTTDEVLLQLFPAGSLLCVALYVYNPLVGELGIVTDLGRFPFIVPNRARAPFWTDPADGSQHPRSQHNFGPRDYLVTEWDFKDPLFNEPITRWQKNGLSRFDIQAALILRFMRAGQLAMVVHSGNRSLHAWWRAKGASEVKGGRMANFFETAAVLGADKAGWYKHQFFRMPGARRDCTGPRQEVVFLSPN